MLVRVVFGFWGCLGWVVVWCGCGQSGCCGLADLGFVAVGLVWFWFWEFYLGWVCGWCVGWFDCVSALWVDGCVCCLGILFVFCGVGSVL